jgi:hypothetical protein
MTLVVERSGAIWWRSTRPLYVLILNTPGERNSISAHHDIIWFSCNTSIGAEVLTKFRAEGSGGLTSKFRTKGEDQFLKFDIETSGIETMHGRYKIEF